MLIKSITTVVLLVALVLIIAISLNSKEPNFTTDCIDPNGITFEHTWREGALFWQYNQYRDTAEGKDYLSRGVESYYRCDRCGKVKIIYQNGDITIFTPIKR